MTLALDDATLVNTLLTLAQAVQTGLLWLLHALGLTGTVAGQPAWPFASRIAIETLLLDRGLARPPPRHADDARLRRHAERGRRVGAARRHEGLVGRRQRAA